MLLRNDKLATPQFLALGAINRAASSYLQIGTPELTGAECRDDFVRGAAHLYRVGICLRAYKKFEGIYDFTVTATQNDDPRERMISTLSMYGISFENGQQLSKLFLERLQ